MPCTSRPGSSIPSQCPSSGRDNRVKRRTSLPGMGAALELRRHEAGLRELPLHICRRDTARQAAGELEALEGVVRRGGRGVRTIDSIALTAERVDADALPGQDTDTQVQAHAQWACETRWRIFWGGLA